MSVPIVYRRVRGPAFCWSTLSWPDLVSDGPRREYLSVSCSTTVFSSAGDSAIISWLPDGASSVVELLTIGWPSAKRIWACCVRLGKNRETRCHQTRNHVSWAIHSTSTLYQLCQHKGSASNYQQILANNYTVIPKAEISFVGWLTKESPPNADPEMASAIIYARMVWEDGSIFANSMTVPAE